MKTCQWRCKIAVLALFTIVVASGATVQGQLVYASGRPSPYVAVRLNSSSRGPSEFAYSGGDGRFYLKNVPAGEYKWRLEPPGGKAREFKVVVPSPDYDIEV